MAERTATLAPVPGVQGIASLVPFGLDLHRPHPSGVVLGALWENRDNLPYAWRVLTDGVCDVCALGPRGLADDVMPGAHLCSARLGALRLETMPALAPADVVDIERLRRMPDAALGALGRIPYPFVHRRGDRGFTRITWDDALAIAGTALRGTPADRQAWCAGAEGITNEAYYAFAKAARLAGTNHVDVCARPCHPVSIAGLRATIGVGAATCSLKDLIGTDLLLLWGTALVENHPGAARYLARAKEKGTRIVVINPVREPGLDRAWVPSLLKSAAFGTRLQDDFVQVTAGGDVALSQGVLKVLIERGAVDAAFVDAHCTGWEGVASQVDATSWDQIERESGVPRTQIEWLGELVGRARSMVTLWSTGLTQHADGTQNIAGVVNLHLARGAFGRPHCGVIPIPGSTGVQGAEDCGVGPGTLPGGVPTTEENLARFEAHWGHSLPRHPGRTTLAMLRAMAEGKVDLLYALGADLAAALPAPSRLESACAGTKLRVHQDVRFNRSMVLDGETVLVLPAQTRHEQRGGGTSTSIERRIRFSPEIPQHPVVGEARAAYEIPCQMAIAAFPRLAGALTYASSQAIRDEMAITMPLYAGVETLRSAGHAVQWGGEILCTGGAFPDGKARFTPVRSTPTRVPEGAFQLTTRRRGLSRRLARVDTTHNDVLIAASDLYRLGCHDGQAVVVVSEAGRMAATLREADIRPGLLQACWPHCSILAPAGAADPGHTTLVRIERT